MSSSISSSMATSSASPQFISEALIFPPKSLRANKAEAAHPDRPIALTKKISKRNISSCQIKHCKYISRSVVGTLKPPVKHGQPELLLHPLLGFPEGGRSEQVTLISRCKEWHDLRQADTLVKLSTGSTIALPDSMQVSILEFFNPSCSGQTWITFTTELCSNTQVQRDKLGSQEDCTCTVLLKVTL